MAQYGNAYVDERYSGIVAPNLYGGAVLQPGITFDNSHQGDSAAGLVKIYKITRDSTGDPQTPAGDFTHEDIASSLIDLRLNNAFRGSKKIYRVTANSVSFDLGEQVLSNLVKAKREDWQRSGIASLGKEGTADSNTTALSTANLKTRLVGTRAALTTGFAEPDVCIMSVAAFALMLEVAGKDYTPETNESITRTGRVGIYLGMRFIESALLGGSPKYYDYASTLQTVDMTKVDYIMYDHEAFKIVNNLEAMRIIDAQNFVGSLAQFEINSGYRVSNSAMVCVKSHA